MALVETGAWRVGDGNLRQVGLDEAQGLLWTIEDGASGAKVPSINQYRIDGGERLRHVPLAYGALGENAAFLVTPILGRICVLSPNPVSRLLGWELGATDRAATPIALPRGWTSHVEIAWMEGTRPYCVDGDGETWARQGDGSWISVSRAWPGWAGKPVHVWRWRMDGRGIVALWKTGAMFHFGASGPAWGGNPRVPWTDAQPAAAREGTFADFLASEDVEVGEDDPSLRYPIDLAPWGREQMVLASPSEISLQIGARVTPICCADGGAEFVGIETFGSEARARLVVAERTRVRVFGERR